VTSYHIRTMDASLNQTMWSLMQGSAGSRVAPKLTRGCLPRSGYGLARLSSPPPPLQAALPMIFDPTCSSTTAAICSAGYRLMDRGSASLRLAG
jgi:hypothetical protein